MNLKNFKHIVSGSMLTLALLTGGIVANAQQTTVPGQTEQTIEKPFGKRSRGFRKFRRGHDGARLMQQLNLTEAQKEQMTAVRLRHRESVKPLREQLRAARQSAKAGLADGQFDEAAIRAAAATMNSARVELAVARAKMRSEIFNILTAEQKTQLAALKEQRKQLRQQRREQRKARRRAMQQAA